MRNKDKKKQKLGRGQGTGKAYKPYIFVQELKSYGRSHRIYGGTIGRLYHFLSDLEANVFRVYDWSPSVVDIREQFPLEQTETLLIAEQLGIRHPAHPKTKEPVVMTTDFVLTIKQEGLSRDTHCARAVKRVKALEDKRTLEKLEIERAYFELREVDWGIVTEQDVSSTLAKNLQSLHPYQWIEQYGVTDEQVAINRAKMESALDPKGIILDRMASAVNDTLNQPAGMALNIAYYLIMTHQWHVDLTHPIKANRPMVITPAK